MSSSPCRSSGTHPLSPSWPLLSKEGSQPVNTNDHRRVLAPLLLFSLAGVVIVTIIALVHPMASPRQVPLSTVLRLSAHHQIARVRLEVDGTVQVVTRAGQKLITRKEDGQILSAALTANGADVSVDA